MLQPGPTGYKGVNGMEMSRCLLSVPVAVKGEAVGSGCSDGKGGC